MKFYPITLAIVAGLFISCERHEFEGPHGTKQLNEPHGAHAGKTGKAGDGEAPKQGETADKDQETDKAKEAAKDQETAN